MTMRLRRQPSPIETTPPPRTVTAAVSTVDMSGAAWKTWKFGDRAWQKDAWRLYDITGQHRFIANWVGSSVSRCRLYVAEVDESGEAGAEAEDQEVAALAAGPLGAGPAKDEALRLLGINLFVPGEAYIVAESGGRDDGEDQWWVVSGRQIRRVGDQVTVKRSQLQGGGRLNFREGTDLLIRCWTPHPADTDEPDSPTRSAIPDLREIEAIRKREFAELDSRLAGAGLLPLPDGIDFPRGDNDPPGIEGFTQTLMRAMSTSLQNRASAEALVPIMFTVPGEYLDKIKLVTFWSELSSQLLPLREAAVKSLAQSLDVPPEVLLGLGQTNHWSAWAISEEAITTQINPILSRIADALTIGYLRSALEALGKDPDGFVYAFDTAPLSVRPNRVADALNYYNAGLLSEQAAITAGAFTTEDLPDDEERLKRLVFKAVEGAPSLLHDPIIRNLLGLPDPMDTPEPVVEDTGQGELPPGEQSDPQSPPEQKPQSEDSPGPAALVAVSNMAIRRALALAGGRLVPHRQRDRWPDTPRFQLHTRHGPVDPARVEELLRGAWDDLPAAADDLRVDPHELRLVLHGLCTELLGRGMAYEPWMLRDLLTSGQVTARLLHPMMTRVAA